MNIAGTAQHLGFTADIFRRRLGRLVSSFAALWCPQRNGDGRVIVGSQAKLHLSDPILAWLPNRLRAGCAEPAFTTLTETTLGVALARRIDDLDEGRWATNDTIGYTRTASGNEVDLSPTPIPTTAGHAMTTPIESKWVATGWRSEAHHVMFARFIVQYAEREAVSAAVGYGCLPTRCHRGSLSSGSTTRQCCKCVVSARWGRRASGDRRSRVHIIRRFGNRAYRWSGNEDRSAQPQLDPRRTIASHRAGSARRLTNKSAAPCAATPRWSGLLRRRTHRRPSRARSTRRARPVEKPSTPNERCGFIRIHMLSASTLPARKSRPRRTGSSHFQKDLRISCNRSC